MSTKILAIDDERDLLELLSLSLGAEGYIVRTAETGAEGLASIRHEKPDLILLDLILDDVSGINLAAKLKNAPETADIPIIMLTAKDKETDIVVGLSVGADDYITKPFSNAVLIARIETILRRTAKAAQKTTKLISSGPIKVNPATMEVFCDNNPVDLTEGEYNILLALMNAPDSILTRADLKDSLGPSAKGQTERIVDVHIAVLRKKLGSRRYVITTVHKKGYRFQP